MENRHKDRCLIDEAKDFVKSFRMIDKKEQKEYNYFKKYKRKSSVQAEFYKRIVSHFGDKEVFI